MITKEYKEMPLMEKIFGENFGGLRVIIPIVFLGTINADIAAVYGIIYLLTEFIISSLSKDLKTNP